MTNDDLYPNSRQHTRDHRGREEFGDPPKAQEAGGEHEGADHQGEERDQIRIPRGAHRRYGGDAGGQHRGDGRVGAHRELATSPEDGEQD